MIEFRAGEIKMKRIYIFTLESEDYPSEIFDNNLRLMTYILYDCLFNYIDAGETPLNINDSIEYNRLNEDAFNHKYRLSSDLYDDGYLYYEPFLIGENSFAITVLDKMIDLSSIQELTNYVLYLLKLNYNVKIDSVAYEAQDLNDESNRYNALRIVYEKLGCKFDRKNNFLGRMLVSKLNRKREKSRKCYDN